MTTGMCRLGGELGRCWGGGEDETAPGPGPGWDSGVTVRVLVDCLVGNASDPGRTGTALSFAGGVGAGVSASTFTGGAFCEGAG